ncbi:hypothetical protein BSL82_02310 [Tardibacter chloracetimidivorans]|uniref:DUF3168 domain-containing protein n=1 Tax=Tardibacter chloracetimidivorans TaxID=1921510 RepID=A0A1L3ZRM8_9SPHN|nr:hypothetical protein [Tardibacter chloracetimidivorans]API58281.1 hypothetical protein BSL82_02310 [Tardibacter chloracetimidivorans]
MTEAIRDRIFGAVVACLQALQGVTVEDTPVGDPDTFPWLGVEDRGQRVIQEGPQVTLYAMNILIEGHVQGDGGADARKALTALYSRTISALTADHSFGGIADDLNEGDLTIQPAQFAEVRTLGFVLMAEIQFFARRTDPALQ